jgi:hypothetical protein
VLAVADKPSILIAVGCSWVSGRAIDTDPAKLEFDIDHVEDPDFVKKYSFAGILQQKLELDDIHFIARGGASNQEQIRKLINWLDQNRDNYSRVFVLWGITSIYRWETYSSSSNCVETCLLGISLSQEAKYYYKNFWNKSYELEKLSQQTLLISHYLNGLNIEYLIFNSFQSFNPQSQIKNFYRREDANNNMLSFLCSTAGIDIENRVWLNLLTTIEQQFNKQSIKQLQQQGLLDHATAHPTVRGHNLIANELYNYIREIL